MKDATRTALALGAGSQAPLLPLRPLLRSPLALRGAEGLRREAPAAAETRRHDRLLARVPARGEAVSRGDRVCGSADRQPARGDRPGGSGEQHVVIVTADHGEGLWDHGYWLHGVDVYEETVRVPLLVRWPGRSRRARASRVPSSSSISRRRSSNCSESRPKGSFDGRSLAGKLLGKPGELPAVPVDLYRRKFDKGVVDGLVMASSSGCAMGPSS